MTSVFLSAATSPGARTASPDSDTTQSPPCQETYTRSAPGSIPHVTTLTVEPTKHMRQSQSESDMTSGSNIRYRPSNSQRAVSTGVLVEETNVEESIAEHRRLTQISPGSSTVRSEEDFIVLSPNTSPKNTPEPELLLIGLETPVGTPCDSKDIHTPLHSVPHCKSKHRRSLSSSEIEIAWSGGPGLEGTNSSSSGLNSPITSVDENQLSTQGSSTVDLEDRSRASSLLTNDTSSMHESGTSDEEQNIHGPNITESISLYQMGNVSPTKQQLLYEARDAVNDVVTRDSEKRNRLRIAKIKAKRYSADFIILNAEDEEPITLKQRTNSTEVLDTNSDVPPQKSPLMLDPNDSVFQNPADLSPSDIEVSIKSGQNSLENSQSTLFFKPTGSPKTIKKLKGKSPLLSRRSTLLGVKYDQEKRGLTKEKVGPTISALKDLLKSASDSEESDHQQDNVFESQHERLVSSPLLRSCTPPSELVDQECSSLDFVPSMCNYVCAPEQFPMLCVIYCVLFRGLMF